MAVPINLTLDESITDAALNRFQTQSLDGYDLFILETYEGMMKVYAPYWNRTSLKANYEFAASPIGQGRFQ